MEEKSAAEQAAICKKAREKGGDHVCPDLAPICEGDCYPSKAKKCAEQEKELLNQIAAVKAMLERTSQEQFLDRLDPSWRRPAREMYQGRLEFLESQLEDLRNYCGDCKPQRAPPPPVNYRVSCDELRFWSGYARAVKWAWISGEGGSVSNLRSRFKEGSLDSSVTPDRTLLTMSLGAELRLGGDQWLAADWCLASGPNCQARSEADIPTVLTNLDIMYKVNQELLRDGECDERPYSPPWTNMRNR